MTETITIPREEYDKMIADIRELRSELLKQKMLASLVTIKQCSDHSHEMMVIAGLNIYCMNEGLATGDERISREWTADVLLNKTTHYEKDKP